MPSLHQVAWLSTDPPPRSTSVISVTQFNSCTQAALFSASQNHANFATRWRRGNSSTAVVNLWKLLLSMICIRQKRRNWADLAHLISMCNETRNYKHVNIHSLSSYPPHYLMKRWGSCWWGQHHLVGLRWRYLEGEGEGCSWPACSTDGRLWGRLW